MVMPTRTLSILKPDLVRRNLIGSVIAKIERDSFRIVNQKHIILRRSHAQEFYYIHKGRPFFDELVQTMTAGVVVIQVLEADNAVEKYRKLIGATNPKEAAPGTIRAEFSIDIGQNSVHGSDSIENASREIAFFFAAYEIMF